MNYIEIDEWARKSYPRQLREREERENFKSAIVLGIALVIVLIGYIILK